MVPFHKQTDPNKQAGQVVFSPVAPNTKQDVTLSDYIARKQQNFPHLFLHTEAGDLAIYDAIAGNYKTTLARITFDEWWSAEKRPEDAEHYRESCHLVWNAALKQGKL
jgi:hypothetical protein